MRSLLQLWALLCVSAKARGDDCTASAELHERVEKLEKLVSEQSAMLALHATLLQSRLPLQQEHLHREALDRHPLRALSEDATAPTLRLGSSVSMTASGGGSDALSIQATTVGVRGDLEVDGAMAAASVSASGSVSAALVSILAPSSSEGVYEPVSMVQSFTDGVNSIYRGEVPLGAGVKHWINVAFRTTVYGYCDLKLMMRRLGREFQFGGATMTFYLYSETDGDFKRINHRSPVHVDSAGSHAFTISEDEIQAIKGTAWNSTVSHSERVFPWWILRFPITLSRLHSYQTLYTSLQCVNANRGATIGVAPYEVSSAGLVLALDATKDASGLDGGGGVWTDTSAPPRHDGILQGGAAYETMEYPRTNPDETPVGVSPIGYVLLSQDADVAFSGQVVDPAGPYTITVWLWRTGDSSGSQTHVFGNGAGTGHIGFRCALREGNGFRPVLSGWKGTAGDINFDVEAQAGPEIIAGKWWQITYQWDGTTSSGGVKIFVDGALEASGTAAAALSSGAVATEDLNLWSTEAGRGFVGRIGSVLAYDRALPESEVRNNYDATRFQYGR